MTHFKHRRCARLEKFSTLLIASFGFSRITLAQTSTQAGTPIPSKPTVAAAVSQSLPSTFVTATDLLFADGMSDPRGGRYRAITIRLASAVNEGKPVATHGWVLLSSGKSNGKRAVAWNGLTYDVAEDMGPADLRQDVETLTDSAKQSRARLPKEKGPWEFDHALPEFQSVDPQSVFFLKVSLLLRVGEPSLASGLYKVWMGEPASEEQAEFQSRTFVDLASCWAGAAFNRAVAAHTRGNDRLAFKEAARLSAAWPKLEAQAAKSGARQPTDSENQTLPFFAFLRPLPDLLADSRRRVTTPESPVDLTHFQEKHPHQMERIAYLIGHLDDIAEYQRSNPGGVGLDAASVSEALIHEGDAAVEPLLNVMDTDERLTRSVQYSRSFYHWDCQLLTVRQAAAECLARILHTQMFDYDYNRTHSTAAIRTYWKANRGIPLAERWYRTLADNTTSPQPWLEAAKNIVESSNAEARVRGESLRTGHNPTVSELLAKRIAHVTTDDGQPACGFPGGHYGDYEGIEGVRLLAQWDLQAAQPLLKALMRRTLHVVYTKYSSEQDKQEIGGDAAILTLWRMSGKDPDAASDYIAFLRNVSPSDYVFGLEGTLSPFIKFRNDPTYSAVLAAAAEALFNGPKSEWNPIAPPESDVKAGAYGREEIISSQLLCVPAFRRQVLRELDDQRDGGTDAMKVSGYVSERGNGTNAGDTSSQSEPNIAPPLHYRICDIYASKLANSHDTSINMGTLGVPLFDTQWTLAKRDAAITALKNYLVRFGDRMTPEYDNSPVNAYYGSGAILLVLPPLNHAATIDDVNAGRAIFTLDNPQARPVQLSRPLPIRAMRLTTKNAATIEQIHLALSGKTKWNITPPNPWIDGAVFQAEEVKEGGKWQRYYGFVDSHSMERVPAEEIILLDESGTRTREFNP